MAKGRKTGGRAKGVPNKDNPLKGYIRTHSLRYFEPRLQTDPVTGRPREIQRQRLVQDDEGNIYKVIDLIPLIGPDGKILEISDFEADLITLSANERVNAELRLLKFHTPEMKAVDMDMTVAESSASIEERLRQLCSDEADDRDEAESEEEEENSPEDEEN